MAAIDPRFFELFNAGQFWHAHEALEDQWQAEGRNPFLQGLILLAAGFVHVQKDNPSGCRTVLEKARARLAPYAPAHRGLDVSAIVAHVDLCLERLGRRPAGQPLPGYIPRIRLAPGVVIREATPADGAGIARVQVDAWCAAYAGIVPQTFLDGMSYAESVARWSARLAEPPAGTSAYVAEDPDGSVIGFAVVGPVRQPDPVYRGELYAIYLLPDRQGRGIGRPLALAAVARLAAEGYPNVVVWVLAENHRARRFYESLGGEPAGSRRDVIGGAELKSVAYGWLDIGRVGRAG